MFSRQGAEIYIAGLNDDEMPLPEVADDEAKTVHQKEKDRLRDVATRFMGKNINSNAFEDDLETVRESLCFRPVSTRGRPIVSRVERLGGSVRGDVFVASGHGPWGISLSLGTGKVVAEMAKDLETSADVGMLGIG